MCSPRASAPRRPTRAPLFCNNADFHYTKLPNSPIRRLSQDGLASPRLDRLLNSALATTAAAPDGFRLNSSRERGSFATRRLVRKRIPSPLVGRARKRSRQALPAVLPKGQIGKVRAPPTPTRPHHRASGRTPISTGYGGRGALGALSGPDPIARNSVSSARVNFIGAPHRSAIDCPPPGRHSSA